MTTLPPPSMTSPGDPPLQRPPEPAYLTAPSRLHVMSRRSLILGAGGLVVSAGGVAAWMRAGGSDSRAMSPSASPSMPARAVAPLTTDPAAGPVATSGGSNPAPDPAAPIAPGVPNTAPARDRVLVVVQMSGGNDALNTLVPIVGGYHDARPTIALADDTLIALPGDPTYGLHPALGALTPHLHAGRLGIVAGIGFPEPDRSHFAALDMWWSAAPGQTFRSGWLGRWLDLGTPSSIEPDTLRVIGLGGAVPALKAERTNAVGVNELDRFALPRTDMAMLDAWSALSPSHAEARTATDAFVAIASGATTAAGGQDPSAGMGESVIDRLVAAAELIVTQPAVQIVHVTMGSFDTHAGQIETQARLLGELAAGVAAFQQRLVDAGQSHRVLLVTTSEFGRRVAENGSSGTDHGKAGVQFVLGDSVRTGAVPGGVSGGVSGDVSVFGTIDPTDLVDGDLRPVVDPRSLYATALDWLGVDPSGAAADIVLGSRYERLPFLPA